MSEDLPKQELLIKLLKMTTSSNDGEATIAIRKANELLKSAGWDWEKLIHGKIKVIEDPFKSVGTPQSNIADNPYRRAPAPPSSRPTPPPPSGFVHVPPQAAPQPRPAPRPRQPAQPVSTKDNMYGGWCYCCGNPVDPKAGFIFDPLHNRGYAAKIKWQIICNDCNKQGIGVIPSKAAIRRRQVVGGATPSLGDI